MHSVCSQAYGVIYVIDCSLNAPFEITRAILHETMHHRHIRGKPLLIIANKQDIPDSIDVIDITYYFHIDEICNRLGTPCLIITSGEDNRQDITVGMDWIVEYVCSNYKALRNRIVFNDIPRSPQKRFIRQRTSVPTNRVILLPSMGPCNILMARFLFFCRKSRQRRGNA